MNIYCSPEELNYGIVHLKKIHSNRWLDRYVFTRNPFASITAQIALLNKVCDWVPATEVSSADYNNPGDWLAKQILKHPTTELYIKKFYTIHGEPQDVGGLSPFPTFINII